MGQLDKEQQDLFTDVEEPIGTADRLKQMLGRGANPTLTIGIELLTAFVTVCIVLMVFVYYMGFLRGRVVERNEISKRVQVIRERQAQMKAVEAAPAAATPVSVNTPQTPAVGAVDRAGKIAKIAKKPYTIQVVAYRSENRALREVSHLRRKGYASQLIKEGSMHVVCVGEYSNRTAAKQDLAALKRKYHDCFLRKF